MTLTQHLGELRGRLTKSVLAVALAIVPAFIFRNYIFAILIRPAGDIQLIYTEMTEMIGTTFKVSLYAGLGLALPYVLYQILSFLAPGLTPRERRYLLTLLPAALFLFAVGVAFGYFVLIPPAAKFLITFGSDIAQPMIKVGNYISLVSTLLFWIGAAFEIPLVLYFLSKIGVVQPKTLARMRKYEILGAFILAALITPTVDPVTQSLVAVPLIVLYEFGLVLSRVARREKPGKVAAPAEEPSS